MIGGDWPYFAETMIGMKRLDNLQLCIEQVLAQNVPGDLIEAGVWRGGAAIFMRGVLKAYGVTDRLVYAADSFAGLPAPDLLKYPADAGIALHTVAYLSVSLESVQEAFRRYGLLDDSVRFLKGFFKDTLPSLAGHNWSVIRLDGDMYESTIDSLANLYPGLSRGGFVILDDYLGILACRAAVDDYRQKNQITDPIQLIDENGVYWKKS